MRTVLLAISFILMTSVVARAHCDGRNAFYWHRGSRYRCPDPRTGNPGDPMPPG